MGSFSQNRTDKTLSLQRSGSASAFSTRWGIIHTRSKCQKKEISTRKYRKDTQQSRHWSYPTILDSFGCVEVHRLVPFARISHIFSRVHSQREKVYPTRYIWFVTVILQIKNLVYICVISSLFSPHIWMSFDFMSSLVLSTHLYFVSYSSPLVHFLSSSLI
jgi:hypothetical protein